MPIVGLTELRIGTSVANLRFLRYRGLPDPDEWTYAPYSFARVSGSGALKGYGFPTASWSWQVLGQDQLNVLLGYFAAATDASVQVYISTYPGPGRSRSTTDYTAYMQRPVDGEGKAMFPRGGGNVFQNVTVQFTHLEAA